MRVILLLGVLWSGLAFGHELPDITKEWIRTVSAYKESIVQADYDKAIEKSQSLLSMDPVSSEAKLYFYLAHKLAKKDLPNWFNEQGWAYGHLDDHFYSILAKELGAGG